ncbi:RagB/SusD family nutrient uptake outer membrane protein [Pedobacter polaris]|uniref:RagB/SusD family nutrient uptake outer membrane protein n=1 Tax=Pedobacter polaris TaxID=2571273 RepID=A0A4V5NYU5_9SPHI|nr:RagB/SusD family nutrient uptake outer membrane protein [Pedobacter polaris]TKC05527.1 RagB/SusD family nutrient uptake outer membrane protein [Pedobacter polaris]
MKTKIYSLLAFGALALTVQSGCKKDFLEKDPINQVTGDVAFVNKEAAEKLLQGAYDGMYNDYHIWDYMINGDVTADNAYAGGDNQANIDIDLFKANSTNGNVGRDWGSLYSDIKNANEVLENVPNIQDPALDAGNRRNEILAEASGLRAYMYFNLVRLFGAVPLVLKTPANLSEMQPAKASIDAVYTQIIKDLEFAATNAKTTSANKGIITKGVANALLAKVYASKPTPDWAKVLQYCDLTIANGYSLFGSYNGLFDAANKNNSEAIWEMQYDGWGGQHGNWMPSVIVGTGWKRFCTPSNDLVKAFNDEGDLIRRNASIYFMNATTEGWSDSYWAKANYPYINKYRADDKSDSYIIRLADILLLKAEALNEASAGGWATAKPIVNQIRGRVSLGSTPAIDQASMRLAIEKERRLELAFEGHRWFDLLRTNRAVAVMNSSKDGAGNNLYNISTANLYFPIPQAEIDRNPNVK